MQRTPGGTWFKRLKSFARQRNQPSLSEGVRSQPATPLPCLLTPDSCLLTPDSDLSDRVPAAILEPRERLGGGLLGQVVLRRPGSHAAADLRRQATVQG